MRMGYEDRMSARDGVVCDRQGNSEDEQLHLLFTREQTPFVMTDAGVELPSAKRSRSLLCSQS